jgi:nucleotide-binding universal stress UspA family protein
VGIGGDQTGVYPCDVSGGWNIIGRSPLRLFDPDREPAALLRTGDRVRFVEIDPAEGIAPQEFVRRRVSPDAVAAITVVAAGLWTTIQDLGRPGHRAEGVPLEGKLVAGAPVEATLEVAKDAGAEYVVIGTHGRTGVARFVLGSVAERLVRLSTVPVIVVPSKHA